MYHYQVIMAALRNRAGHYIFVVFSSFYLLLCFFPHVFSAVADWWSTIRQNLVWP